MGQHLYKTFEMKANDNGTIEGYFSTYDKTPDSYGDIIEPGAFTGTIARRKETGHPFPLCFNHDFSAVIGAVNSIEERENGPFIEASFLDTQQAQDVRKMLLSGAIYQFSFAYEILKRRNPTEEEEKAGVTNVLTELEVFEISVVTVPANQNAVATEVKAQEGTIGLASMMDAPLYRTEPTSPVDYKAGRRNSKKDEDVIKQIRDLAQSLLDGEDEDTPGEDEAGEEAEPKANGNTEEPKDDGNLKRAEAILEKITAIKGGSST